MLSIVDVVEYRRLRDLLELRQIGARAEVLAGALQQNRRRLGLGLIQSGLQIADEPVIDRIALLGAIERDIGDAVFHISSVWPSYPYRIQELAGLLREFRREFAGLSSASRCTGTC